MGCNTLWLLEVAGVEIVQEGVLSLKGSVYIGIAIMLFTVTVVGLSSAQSGEEIYSKKCSGCHTIGGGDLAGPDLAGITQKRDKEWLIRVIVEPDKLARENDPIMNELISRYGYQMPNVGVTREEAELILEFLSQFSVPEETQPEEKETPVPSPEITPEETVIGDPGSGRMLFIGEKRFENGGAPCISCHSVKSAGVNGGNLAKDLSDLYSRLGEKGVYGALKSLQFPIMKDIYQDKKLTKDEIADLVAFFKEAEQGQRKVDQYPLSGFAVFLVALVIAGVYYGRVK